MGNKLGRRRQVVDERYTRPQGLYVHKDVDIKKLRKLILESKLAPCYPGDEECCHDLEECPICFLYYPSLNRSRCCMKGICTECFLQMKNPNSTRPTQCPFCKTSNYAVEYRGVKTNEERGLEQIEEQRVIEAKIRMRQQELQDDEHRMQKRQESASSIIVPGMVQYSSVSAQSSVPAVEGEEETVSLQETEVASLTSQPMHHRANRDEEFDLDLEDIMVMEAIWLSIQENGRQKNVVAESYSIEDSYVSTPMASVTGSSSSPSGGLACAIAALAERQQTGAESSSHHSGNLSSTNMISGSSRIDPRTVRETDEYHTSSSSYDMPAECRITGTRDGGEWSADRGSDIAEAGTSYASSEVAEGASGYAAALPQPENVGTSFQAVSGPLVPESFEEQMMLAMAVSLAEARPVSSGREVSWQ